MSQLIGPEEFIKLETFQKAFKDIYKDIESLLAILEKGSKTVKTHYTEVDKGADSVKKLGDNQKKANESTTIASDIEKEVTKVQEKRYKLIIQQSEAVKKETDLLKKDNEERKKAEKLIKAEADSLEGLRAKQQLLRESRDKLKFSDKDYAANLKKVNKEIDENDKAIRKATDGEEKRSRKIGKYKEDIVKAYVAIQGAIILARGAFNLFIDVLNSTGSTQDAFTATLEGWKQGFNAVKVAITALDFKDFTKRVKDAIDEGRRYAEGLDEVDDKTRALEIAESKLNNTILEQRKIQNSALSTSAQRIAAGEKIKKLEEDMQVIRTGIAQQAYENEITNIAAIANKTKEVTDAMKEEVRLYVERDAEFMKRIERGQKIADSLDVINKKYDYAYASHIAKGEKEKTQLKENTEAWNDYLLLQRVTLPIDEKYNILKQKTVDLEHAKGSALENTLRIQSKLDSAINKGDTQEKKIKSEEAYAKQREMFIKGERQMLEDSDKEEEARGIERAKTMEEIDRQYYEARIKADEETQKRLDASYIKDRENFLREQDAKNRAIEESKRLSQESMNLLYDIGLTFGDRKIADIEEETQKELDLVGGKHKVLTAEERKKQQIEEEAAKKIGAIKKKQWIADKVAALSNIAINFAIAKSKGFAQAGPVLGIPLAAWMTIQAVLQAALVLAQPMPKFFKGGIMKKTGLAKVGEEGFELGETKEGKMFLTPDRATTMLLSEGTKITTHEKTIEKLKEMDGSKVDEMVKMQGLMINAIKSRPNHITKFGKDGMTFITEYGNSRKVWLDKYIQK